MHQSEDFPIEASWPSVFQNVLLILPFFTIFLWKQTFMFFHDLYNNLAIFRYFFCKKTCHNVILKLLWIIPTCDWFRWWVPCISVSMSGVVRNRADAGQHRPGSGSLLAPWRHVYRDCVYSVHWYRVQKAIDLVTATDADGLVLLVDQPSASDVLMLWRHGCVCRVEDQPKKNGMASL